MGRLLHEDQKEFFDYLFALGVNIAFVALIVLLLWPLGRVNMAVRLAKGYWMFWTVLIVTSAVLALVQSYFRIDLYERYNAYVISGLAWAALCKSGGRLSPRPLYAALR